MLEPVKRKIAPGRGKYWIQFFVSSALMLGMMAYPPTAGWFWVVIPFVCTSIVQAYDAM